MTRDNLRFRFVHATDLHYEAQRDPRVPKANARIRCLIDDINTLDAEDPFSFVLLSGDLTDRGAACMDALSEARSLYERFNPPIYAVAGNHDLAPNRRYAAMYPGKEDYHDGDIATSNFARVFGAQGLRFSFVREGLRFIGFSLRDGDPDGSLDWLDAEIANSAEQVIITSHYGLYPPRDAGFLHTWGFSRIGRSLPRLRRIFAEAGDTILAYLYGHNHINSVVKVNGTTHISGGGIQRGCTGYRVFHCYDDRIESTFHVLSDEALRDFNTWGHEHPGACQDAAHRTVEAYHRGSVKEQTVSIQRGDAAAH